MHKTGINYSPWLYSKFPSETVKYLGGVQITKNQNDDDDDAMHFYSHNSQCNDGEIGNKLAKV